ncbi:acyl carrier protein [Streptomyces pathocidini]|uniref:Acyl carrier protein n=1 Tax=Streptomyces pathocidini TaxID=1650571 RepID=A0ABW7UV75_9ACTN|nr:acyl carrier protein [Streptomyces pathocidini]
MDQRFTELLRPFLKFTPGGAAGEPVAITPETDLRALGIDSMQAIELLFAIEDAFAISLPDEELNDTTFATAGSLWNAVAAQLTAPTGPVAP